MMSKYKSFIANGVHRYSDGKKPTVTVYPDPLNLGKYVACFQSTDCDEMVNGYNYDELLSIRNAINEALTDIDVRESVAELNSKDPGYNPFND
jgi:hypothetical protein